MSAETQTIARVPKDCLGCRIVGAAGLIGIGGYLAKISFNNKTLPGRVVIATTSLTFVSLGVARFRQTFPFQKREMES